MYKKIITPLIITLLFSLTTLSWGQSATNDYKLGKSMELLINIFREANLYYVDSIDSEKMLEDATRAMLNGLDPYTEYISADEMELFETMTTGLYGGIGALITKRGEWIEIAEPYKGTPSDKAGLKAGDRILVINGVDMKNIDTDKVSGKLRGEPGTLMTLRYRPISDTLTEREVQIQRERILQPSVPYYGFIKPGIGYIKFDTFIENSSKEVHEAIFALEKIGKLEGLILDLRENTGGIVDEAVKIASFFLPKGTEVLLMKGKIEQFNKSYSTASTPTHPNLPLVIVQSSISASASEILSGALQDIDRAVVVGQRSFGKGLVQSPRPVGYDSYLKITIAKYYIPSGRSVQALDYTHRKEDGSVGMIPDSLITEHCTVAGRRVYSGGGIQPDVITEREYLSKFTAILLGYGLIDDFANLYAAYNQPQPLEELQVSNEMYEQFVDYMRDREIEYVSGTSHKLTELKEWAVREKYDERLQEEFAAIEAKITEDKIRELRIFADEIKNMLGQSIATRWHYQAGGIEYMLKSRDNYLDKATEILLNRDEYIRILREQDTAKK